jgi:hypothetical protein
LINIFSFFSFFSFTGFAGFAVFVGLVTLMTLMTLGTLVLATLVIYLTTLSFYFLTWLMLGEDVIFLVYLLLSLTFNYDEGFILYILRGYLG